MKSENLSITTDDGVRLNVTIYSASTESDPGPSGPRDILLLHGWPNSGKIWSHFSQAMLTAASGYRLIAPDLRGFGASYPAEFGYSCERFAQDALAVAKSLALTDWALIGHSMGGKIAQLVAAAKPEGLQALVLLAPAPLGASPTPEEKKTAQRTAFGDPVKTRAVIQGMMAHSPSDSVLDSLTDDGLRVSVAGWNGWIDTMRDVDFSARLADISVPTLVIAGAKDPQRTEEGLRSDVADRISGATIQTLPGVGHLAHVEDPVLFAVTLVNFLEPISRPVAAVGG